MNTNQTSNPLGKKTELIQRFIRWSKRKIKSIITIGSIGLVFAGIQAYKALFPSDITSEINDVINSAIERYGVMVPVAIPDSLFEQNSEVRLLKSYQDEFEMYKTYLQALDLSDFSAGNDTIAVRSFEYRYGKLLEYDEKAGALLQCIARIVEYEQSRGNVFVKPDLLESLKDANEEFASELVGVYAKFLNYYNRGFDKLTLREKKEMSKVFQQGIASKSLKRVISLQTELFESTYIAVSIRLKELLRG